MPSLKYIRDCDVKWHYIRDRVTILSKRSAELLRASLVFVKRQTQEASLQTPTEHAMEVVFDSRDRWGVFYTCSGRCHQYVCNQKKAGVRLYLPHIRQHAYD
eukprot:6187379-Pleurochrysis_carterae.AAC.1